MQSGEYARRIQDAIDKSLEVTDGKAGPLALSALVFRLARHLKDIPEFRGLEAMDLLRVVDAWHGRAPEHVRAEPVGGAQVEFDVAWGLVRYAASESPLTAAWALAWANPEPDADVRRRVAPGVWPLVAFCKALQSLCPGEPFYLSCREAAKFCGYGGPGGHVQANRFLFHGPEQEPGR